MTGTNVQAMCPCKDYRRFGQISTIFASVELKIFETVIAFLNNRISCIAVTIVQFLPQLARKLFGGAKARLAPVEPPMHLQVEVVNL